MENKTKEIKVEKKEIDLEGSINEALKTWNYPQVPKPIIAKNSQDMEKHGKYGKALKEQYAFMDLPTFQTYINLEKITKTFNEDPERGLKAISKHEIGHRFCPYDTITLIILNHEIQKAIKNEKLPCDYKQASSQILNLFTDMCINTKLARQGDDDIPFAYHQITKAEESGNSKLWRVYAKSMELAWNKKILPETTKLSREEKEAAEDIKKLFRENFFNSDRWQENVKDYALIICKFFEKSDGKGKGQGEGEGQGDSLMDNISGNIPKEIDEKTAKELAKRLAKNGTDGLPTDKKGLEKFRDIMAGFGYGNKQKASIQFYDMLSDAYEVIFAPKPWGRDRPSPFQPVKWQPSMGADKLDVPYSIISGGKIIPGVNTYTWKSRRKEVFGGFEEIILNLDLYLDSSGSMPNPIDEISLPVLAGFVAAKKAHKKGAYISVTNFSGRSESQESTRDLNKVFEALVTYFGGGTTFPASELKSPQKKDPRQVLIITDTFLNNTHETAEAIKEIKNKNKGNNVSIYAISNITDVDELKSAGAEVIQDTTTKIFKKVIGKAHEVYKK